MSLTTGRSKMFNAMKTLSIHWHEVQEVWNDPVQRHFEEKFWKPLESQMASWLRANDRLELQMQQMRRDCS
jgi:hypothetical protein